MSELRVFDFYIVIEPFVRNGQLTSMILNPRDFIELAACWCKRYPRVTTVLVWDKSDALAARNYGFRVDREEVNLMGLITFSQLCNVIA